jgi:hypothetical protein
MDVDDLLEQVKELRRSKLRLIGELSALIGYASTCQEVNRKQWLDSLHRHIERAKEVVDQETHIFTTSTSGQN